MKIQNSDRSEEDSEISEKEEHKHEEQGVKTEETTSGLPLSNDLPKSVITRRSLSWLLTYGLMSVAFGILPKSLI
jgi:hypothetical protein